MNKNKDFSENILQTIGEFVYKDFPAHQDKVLEELKNISQLLWILVVVVIIHLFI